MLYDCTEIDDEEYDLLYGLLDDIESGLERLPDSRQPSLRRSVTVIRENIEAHEQREAEDHIATDMGDAGGDQIRAVREAFAADGDSIGMASCVELSTRLARIDERSRTTDGRTAVDRTASDLAKLFDAGLSPAEAVDFLVTTKGGLSQLQWGDIRGVTRTAINNNVRDADEKLTRR